MAKLKEWELEVKDLMDYLAKRKFDDLKRKVLAGEPKGIQPPNDSTAVIDAEDSHDE